MAEINQKTQKNTFSVKSLNFKITSAKMTAHFSGVLTADFRNYLKDSLRRFAKIALRQRRTSFFCPKNVSNFSVLRQTVPETFFSSGWRLF